VLQGVRAQGLSGHQPAGGDCFCIASFFGLFSFFSFLPIKLSLTQPTNFLTVALLWGAVSEWLRGAQLPARVSPPGSFLMPSVGCTGFKMFDPSVLEGSYCTCAAVPGHSVD